MYATKAYSCSKTHLRCQAYAIRLRLVSKHAPPRSQRVHKWSRMHLCALVAVEASRRAQTTCGSCRCEHRRASYIQRTLHRYHSIVRLLPQVVGASGTRHRPSLLSTLRRNSGQQPGKMPQFSLVGNGSIPALTICFGQLLHRLATTSDDAVHYWHRVFGPQVPLMCPDQTS